MARGDALVPALLALFSLGLSIGLAVAATRAAGIPLQSLGVYFDGRIYLEIARSFPLPYAPEALDYAGHAPGYPALVWLLRVLLPDALVNWGGALLLASWLGAAVCAVLFHAICRELELDPLVPSVLFVVAFPRWLSIAATPHAEAPAMAFALASLLAYLRGRVAWCALLLAPAALCRYPALLLGGPLALGVLVWKRQASLRNVALFAVPLLVPAALHLYLSLRIPGFSSILGAHSVFWDTQLTWPFAALLESAHRFLWPPGLPLAEVTYLSVGFFLYTIASGFERGKPWLWVLPLWVAVQVIFHASLSGIVGAWDFTRLAVLAWPAALLILWRQIGAGVPAWAGWGVALACGVFSAWFVTRQVPDLIRHQRAELAWVVRTLDEDAPHWDTWEWSRPGATRSAPP